MQQLDAIGRDALFTHEPIDADLVDGNVTPAPAGCCSGISSHGTQPWQKFTTGVSGKASAAISVSRW